MEFIRASSYVGTHSTGDVKVDEHDSIVERVRGRHVIVIEDIVDTGTTLAKLLPLLDDCNDTKGCASLEVCSLLDKRIDDIAARKDLLQNYYPIKYIGFSIPNVFIVGYGLDYNELYRDIPDIFTISQMGIDYYP